VKEILDRYGGAMKAAGLAAAAAAKKTKTGRDGRKTPTSKTNAATLSHHLRALGPNHLIANPHRVMLMLHQDRNVPPLHCLLSRLRHHHQCHRHQQLQLLHHQSHRLRQDLFKSMRRHDTRAHAASANETSNAHCKPAFAHPPKRTSVTSILAPSTASTTISSAKHGTSAVTTPNAAAATSATSSSNHPTVPINDHHTQR